MDIVLGSLSALMSSLAWAIGVSRYSRLLLQHSGFTINASRALVATPLFFLVFLIQMGSWEAFAAGFAVLELHRLGWFLTSSFASLILGDFVFLAAANRVGAPTALTLASVFPLWSALAAVVWRGEGLRGAQWLGLSLVLASVAWVIRLTSIRPSDPAQDPADRVQTASELQAKSSRRVLGLLFGVGTSLFWALNAYSVSEAGKGIEVSLTNGIRMGMSLALCPLFYRVFLRKWRGSFLSGTVFKKNTGIFALEAFLGSYCYVYSMTHAPLAVASALSSLAPVIAMGIGVVQKTERFSGPKLGGILGVLAGLWLLVSGG